MFWDARMFFQPENLCLPALALNNPLGYQFANTTKGTFMSDIKRIESGARMSQAVVHNGVAYLAGQVGAEGASVTEQTKDVLASVDRLLGEVGSDKTRLLTAQIWVADIADFAKMNAVWDDWVAAGHAPARWTGEAKLATPGFKVEVIVTAAV